MTVRPEVTFVVPNYNGARFLRATIESILAQHDPAFSLILADNRSTDGSVEIARSYADPRLTIALADSHVSMSENWNRSFGYVRTPYAVLAHADDVYESEYLAGMLPLLRAHPDAFAAHCRVTNIDEHGRPLDLPLERYKERFWPDTDPVCRSTCDEAAWLRKGNYVSAPSVIYRMDCVRRIGEFNPRFQFVPDWEYWLRGVFAGYEFVGTRRRLLKYRKHASSLTRAAEATLTRYKEEIELLRWLAERGAAAGCFPEGRADFGLVSNTLTSELADRLAHGDAEGAARLAAFARENVPGFRWSARDLGTRCMLPFGTSGGRALVSLREWYLRRSA